MFKDIYSLAKQSAFSLLISVSGNDLRVVLQPRPPKESDIPKLAEQGLMEPLVLQGSPVDLDEQFHSLVSRFTEARQSLVEQLETATNALKAAKEKSAKQANVVKERKAASKSDNTQKPHLLDDAVKSSSGSEDDESELQESSTSNEKKSDTTPVTADLSFF